jgi:hypothetical protein
MNLFPKVGLVIAVQLAIGIIVCSPYVAAITFHLAFRRKKYTRDSKFPYMEGGGEGAENRRKKNSDMMSKNPVPPPPWWRLQVAQSRHPEALTIPRGTPESVSVLSSTSN